MQPSCISVLCGRWVGDSQALKGQFTKFARSHLPKRSHHCPRSANCSYSFLKLFCRNFSSWSNSIDRKKPAMSSQMNFRDPFFQTDEKFTCFISSLYMYAPRRCHHMLQIMRNLSCKSSETIEIICTNRNGRTMSKSPF